MNLFQVPVPTLGLMGRQAPRPRMATTGPDAMLAALAAQMAQPEASVSAVPPPRERVSLMNVLGRALAPNTFAALDGERTRLENERFRPQRDERRARIEAAINGMPVEAQIAYASNPEKFGENLSEMFGVTTTSAGGRSDVMGLGRTVGANSFSTVNDNIYRNNPLTGESTVAATAPASFADVTNRYQAENPTVAANARVVNLPSGRTVAEGYIEPQVTNTPEGGTTNVFDSQGRVINQVQGNPSSNARKSFTDTLGVRRFEDTGEPVFPDDFNRIRGQAENRVTAANQAATNLSRTIREALDLSGGGETGMVGAVMGAVPGTRARRLRAVIETIKSNVGFNYLQQMRELSPTGGALGNVAQQELASLQSVWGNLDPNASEEQLDGVLRQMLTMVDQGTALRGQAFQAQYGAAPAVRGSTSGGSGPIAQDANGNRLQYNGQAWVPIR